MLRFFYKYQESLNYTEQIELVLCTLLSLFCVRSTCVFYRYVYFQACETLDGVVPLGLQYFTPCDFLHPAVAY